MSVDILGLLEEFAKTDKYEGWTGHTEPDARAVNGGLCGDFADFVVEQSGGSVQRMTTADVLGVPDSTRPDPWHVWVTDGNQHYDAETPAGVDAWTSLPYFRRNL